MEWYDWIILGWLILHLIGSGLYLSGALDEIAKAKKGKEMTAKDRYKVGDKVRIVDKWPTTRSCHNISGRMDHWLGKVMTIREFGRTGSAYMEEDRHEGGGWVWNDAMIAGLAGHEEKLTPLKIVVTTDGKTTLARYYEGKKAVHTAEAICNGDDTFDFGTGAKLATERLLEKMTPQPPKFKTGDVVRVTGNDGDWLGTPYRYHALMVGGFGKVEFIDPVGWPQVRGICGTGDYILQGVMPKHLELVETK